MSISSDTPNNAVVKTLFLTDLVDSTKLFERLGDERAAKVSADYDRVARSLLDRFHGREIDKTDGFLLLFDRPIDATRYALAYQSDLDELSERTGVPISGRVGIHLGEVFLRENSPEDVARGAKPLEVEGLAKHTVARVASLARGGQTLLTQGAFDLARRAAVGETVSERPLGWLAHGPYVFKGIAEPLDIFEVGEEGVAPLSVPQSTEKARRAVTEADELTLGWRPATGLDIPQRANWLLADKLGEGGFGEVWLATHKNLGQQVSVRGATTVAGRLTARYGEPVTGDASGLTVLFPVPEALAGAEIENCGFPGARGRAITFLARAVSEGELSLVPSADPEEVRRKLYEIPGIGPWTADYITMRALCQPDAFPVGDLGLRKAASTHDRTISPRQLEEMSEEWRPWRAYAAMLLWNSL